MVQEFTRKPNLSQNSVAADATSRYAPVGASSPRFAVTCPGFANRRGVLALVALSIIVTLTPRQARATEPLHLQHPALSNPEFDARLAAQDERRLDLFLSNQAEKSRASVPWLGATSLALGAIAIGAGTELTLRKATVPGFVVIGQGAIAVAGGSLLLLRQNEPFAELERAFENERGAGRSDAELLEKTLSHWDRLAAEARSRRHLWGTTSTIVGSLLTVAAVVVATPSPSTLSMTNREQALTTSVLISAGIATASAGILTLLLESPIEQTRHAFATGESTMPAPEASFLRSVRIAAAPTVDAPGALGMVQASF